MVDLTEEGQSVVLNFALAESLRPSVGPGLALAEADRARNLVAAGAWLGVDKLLATRLVTEGGVEYLTAAMFDVRRGILQREGRVRLANKLAPSGSLSALATFVVTGQASPQVDQTAIAATQVPLPPPPKGAPDLKPRPSSAAGSDVDFRKSSGPQAKSKTMGWVAVGAGGASVLLGVFAVYEGTQAKSKYGDAKNLLRSDGAVQQNASVSQYQSLVSDGDSAKSKAYIGAGAAVGCAVAAGVLGYMSYKQTGEIGPFRF
jgi:hypothetical protein